MNLGEDKIVTIYLEDENGAVIAPSSFVGLIVEVYEQIGQPIAKYSIVPFADYDTINNINDLAGTFEINLHRSVVKKYLLRKLLAEVKSAESNAAFEDSEFHTISDPFEIDLLKKVQSTETDVPV